MKRRIFGASEGYNSSNPDLTQVRRNYLRSNTLVGPNKVRLEPFYEGAAVKQVQERLVRLG
jgi:hypothetical protein